MRTVDKLIMFRMAVSDMPRAKAFYADMLGLIVTKDYRQDDKNWWVWLTLPDGRVTIILATYHEHIKPATAGVYFVTSDLLQLTRSSAKRVQKSKISRTTCTAGSGAKLFNLEDPHGAQVLLVQAF